MKVLIVSYLASFSPSGVVTAYQTLVRDLTDRGVDVRVVDASTTPWLWRKGLGVLKRLMRPVGGAVSALYDEFAYFTGVYLATRGQREENFDLIHAQDVRSAIAAYRALGGRVPVVLTCHFNDDPVTELVTRFSLKPGFTRFLTRWYAYLFSAVKNYVFTSEYTFTKTKHLLPATINKLILHNTVNLGEAVSRPARTPSDPLIITNVGYVDSRKNQKLLIEIGHELHRRGRSNFTIWLIGDGPQRAEYEHLAERLGLTDRVRFWGQQEAPWKLVAQSDVYVHTALNDNCPYALIEAFAVKTPVLALPVGGIPELLPNGAGALRGTTAAELANEVALFFDPEKRLRLVNVQSANAEEQFSPSTAVARLLAFYQQAMPNTNIAWLTSAPGRVLVMG